VRNITSRRRAVLLALCGASSALVYAAILMRLPLTSIYTRALLNLNNIPLADWPTGAAVLGCAIFLFGAYVVGGLCVAGGMPTRRGGLLIAGIPLAFVALLLFAHPVTSTDVYDYLFRGRMLARYDANPFVTPPWEFRSDPLIKYVAWKLVVTSYGPLWEVLSWLTLRLAGEAPNAPLGPAEAQLLRMIFAYKALAALGFLLCGAAIWLGLRRAGPRMRRLGLYLWLWNPLALWETVGAAHNDVWMALFIVLAAAALSVRQGDRETGRQGESVSPSPDLPFSLSRSIGALLALTAGGLVKYVAFFFGPVALAAGLRRLPGPSARLRLIAAGGAACGALVALAYAPFWAGVATLQNIGDRRDLYTASWLGVLRVVLKQAMPEERAATVVAAASLALLFAGVVWATWRAWREPENVAGHMLWLALWLLFVCNPWFQPWYAIWPLALAAAQPWKQRAVAGVALLCAVSLVSYVVGGLVLPALGLPDKSVGREAAMAALITIPPLLVLGWDRLSRGWRALRRLPRAIGARRIDPMKSGRGG
jgi:alpha-1,6-mannosyltransferase